MNLDAIEILLVEKIRRLLRNQADVVAGPVSTLALGGMQETVFIHAARFEDNKGITHDGASIARRPFRIGRASGIAEERPCLVVIEVTCIATAYSRIQALSGEIAPEILLALTCEREFELGASGNRLSSLKFADFQACLDQAETFRQEDDGLVFHLERLIFHLNGALHIQMSKYGGLKAKQSSLEKKATKSIKKPTRVKPVKKPKK